ncbi:hypothetical protein L9F63_005047, partial [Diploptera punctata]
FSHKLAISITNFKGPMFWETKAARIQIRQQPLNFFQSLKNPRGANGWPQASNLALEKVYRYVLHCFIKLSVC